MLIKIKDLFNTSLQINQQTNGNLIFLEFDPKDPAKKAVAEQNFLTPRHIGQS